MACADLGEELCCSICLEVYLDPVTLSCGHSFCRCCLELVLDSQRPSGVYSCPNCLERFPDRPAPYRNVTLRSIAQLFRSSPQEGPGTYRATPQVPAIRACPHCDEGRSGPPEGRRCPAHEEVCANYCTDHSAWVCETCLAGRNWAQPVHRALEEKMAALSNILERQRRREAVAEDRLRRLRERKKGVRERAAREAARASATFRDVTKHLRDLEARVLAEISRQEEETLREVDGRIREAETRKDELRRRLRYVEALRDDPVALLRERFTDCGDAEEEDAEEREGSDPGETWISETLLQGLSEITAVAKRRLSSREASGLLLDVATAADDAADLSEAEVTPQRKAERAAVSGVHDGGDPGETRISEKSLKRPSDITAVAEGRPISWEASGRLLDVTIATDNETDLSKVEEECPVTPRWKADREEVSGVRDGGDPGETWISEKSLQGLYDITAVAEGNQSSQETCDLLLDVTTAAHNVLVSADLRGAAVGEAEEELPWTPHRFQRCQVLSAQAFSFGRRHWEVLTSQSGGWRFGMAYPGVRREGAGSALGDDNNSWCLRKFYGNLAARHGGRDLLLGRDFSARRFRVLLDYEGGQMSFYELGDPVTHLHTFTAAFSEPLHAALYVAGAAWLRITS